MKAKWGHEDEMGEVLRLHPETDEEDAILGEIRHNPGVIIEWYKAQGGV